MHKHHLHNFATAMASISKARRNSSGIKKMSWGTHKNDVSQQIGELKEAQRSTQSNQQELAHRMTVLESTVEKSHKLLLKLAASSSLEAE